MVLKADRRAAFYSINPNLFQWILNWGKLSLKIWSANANFYPWECRVELSQDCFFSLVYMLKRRPICHNGYKSHIWNWIFKYNALVEYYIFLFTPMNGMKFASKCGTLDHSKMIYLYMIVNYAFQANEFKAARFVLNFSVTHENYHASLR